jgi:hypothetical protein
MLIIVFLVILVAIIDMVIGIKIENKYKPTQNRDKCIVDLLQETLPDLTDTNTISNQARKGILKNIVSFDDIFIIIVFIILIMLHGTKYLLDIGILYIILSSLRIITKAATILPKSNKKCKPPTQRNSIHRFLTGGCNDAIFSGHVSQMIIMLLFINKGIKHLYIKIILLIFCIFYSFFIIMLQNHYTVDVVLAWYIAITAFIIYENRGILTINL